jgi:hypothetical protein
MHERAEAMQGVQIGAADVLCSLEARVQQVLNNREDILK